MSSHGPFHDQLVPIERESDCPKICESPLPASAQAEMRGPQPTLLCRAAYRGGTHTQTHTDLGRWQLTRAIAEHAPRSSPCEGVHSIAHIHSLLSRGGRVGARGGIRHPPAAAGGHPLSERCRRAEPGLHSFAEVTNLCHTAYPFAIRSRVEDTVTRRRDVRIQLKARPRQSGVQRALS